MSEGKAQIEKTIEICKQIAEGLGQLADSQSDQTADAKKRISDIIYALEGIQNKVFFKTKASLNFTIPTLSSAERVLEAVEDQTQGNGDIGVLMDELDSLESNVETLKVKVASQDIIIT